MVALENGRGVAQPGSAPAWGAGGRQFKSGRPDHTDDPLIVMCTAILMAHLMQSLTPEMASSICMNQCRAMCCRGPLILRLTTVEVASFQIHAQNLDVNLVITPTQDGAGWVYFSHHTGSRCPMLDEATSACRIYEERPQRCHSFPERPTPGCAISGE